MRLQLRRAGNEEEAKVINEMHFDSFETAIRKVGHSGSGLLLRLKCKTLGERESLTRREQHTMERDTRIGVHWEREAKKGRKIAH